MKLRISALILWLILFSTAAQKINAHVLQKNGSVGAVLHISPEDDPVAGEQSGFFFEFKDTEGKFKPGDCLCTVTVKENGKEIYTQTLFEDNPNPSLSDASFLYTFPEKNIYQLRVEGKPKSPHLFQPFTLTYDVRVARDTGGDTQTPASQSTVWSFLAGHIPHTVAGIIAVIGLWYFLFKKK